MPSILSNSATSPRINIAGLSYCDTISSAVILKIPFSKVTDAPVELAIILITSAIVLVFDKVYVVISVSSAQYAEKVISSFASLNSPNFVDEVGIIVVVTYTLGSEVTEDVQTVPSFAVNDMEPVRLDGCDSPSR